MQHEKKALMLYANSGGPDEPAHPCNLIWTFSVHQNILQYPRFYKRTTKDQIPYTICRQCRPWSACTFAKADRACIVHKLYKGLFMCWASCFRYSLEAPLWGISYEYPQYIFSCIIIIRHFTSLLTLFKLYLLVDDGRMIMKGSVRLGPILPCDLKH